MSNRTSFSILSALLALIIIGAGGIVLKPRLSDLILAYNYVTTQMFGDVETVIVAGTESDYRRKEVGPAETRKRLMSLDPNIRLETIRAIEEKSDPQFIPQMIKLLNDTTLVAGNQAPARRQISEAAKSAVIKLAKDNIVREPGNIAQFLPLFQACLNGSHAEKIGAIDILSDLHESTAYPLLRRLSLDNAVDPEIVSKANSAMRSLIPISVTSTNYLEVTSRRVEFMYVLLGAGLIMGIAAIVGLIKKRHAQFAALCLLATVLNVGLGVLVHAELNRGVLTHKTIQDALNTEDFSALRTMCYTDNTTYPGDSFFCQDLVQIGGVDAFCSLIAIPRIEPDDLAYLKTNFQIRSRWIMSRIFAVHFGQPVLETILNSSDTDVSFAVAETLDQLGVQNGDIKRYLEILTQDDRPEKVRKIAEKTLSELKNRPIWPSI